MKLTVNIFVLVALSAALLTFSGCKPGTDPAPSDEEVQFGKLSKTWKATSVKKDEVVDKTGYNDFTLKLTGTFGASSFDYTTTGRPALSPWPSSGNWVFDTDALTSIIRDKGNTTNELKMTYAVTETTLKLNFTYNGAGVTGRTSNVKGVWVMDFVAL